MKTYIECKEDLFNDGQCFTKGEQYEVNGFVSCEAGLMDKTVSNDLGEDHVIGSWWRSFDIVDQHD